MYVVIPQQVPRGSLNVTCIMRKYNSSACIVKFIAQNLDTIYGKWIVIHCINSLIFHYIPDFSGCFLGGIVTKKMENERLCCQNEKVDTKKYRCFMESTAFLFNIAPSVLDTLHPILLLIKYLWTMYRIN